jgi:hypothetical protein
MDQSLQNSGGFKSKLPNQILGRFNYLTDKDRRYKAGNGLNLEVVGDIAVKPPSFFTCDNKMKTN